ncbi:DEHA2F24156p [Debaryomyces hansenii CBS767]|uniref:DEHA2F24156p n=1 Tax=Debaryomyces hansenii (strain ATCC 36239 / CBS 767 / BCRC 21394 / JCM 1990 / NBRC 0083 / IGC 2968) TaxID=284592 RepID=Q6BK79_DEBHA|nr:DEHA2F24156p [Debaryomyces hansenii CBS767]CAG89799.2 DEHA2F24156p [Debaryomyces hansenii CBS767]|eukprot:XP_461392.2 DEHA2F24156p [Debaryomyces hansenii CBS767]
MISGIVLALGFSPMVMAIDLFGTTHKFNAAELSEMTLIERLKVHNWGLEYLTLGFTIVFIILFKAGDVYNQYLTTSYLKGLGDVFKKNFFQYGVTEKELYIKDSSEDYSSYATGRINIAKVNIDIKLKPRHNIFVWVLESVMSFFTDSVVYPTDKVNIEITPSPEANLDNFISAVVSKLGMNDFRKFNYFLSLTRTSDSANIPESFVLMSEANEFQEKTLTPELKKALTLQAASFLKFIAITDQPIERPETIAECAPKQRILISTTLTSNGDQLAQLSEILAAIFNLVDQLASKQITFKSDALKKIVKTRELEISKIKKVLDDVKQEELAAEKAKLKRAERTNLRNLSREEQIKLEKKEAEKKQRKAQRKQRVKM